MDYKDNEKTEAQCPDTHQPNVELMRHAFHEMLASPKSRQQLKEILDSIDKASTVRRRLHSNPDPDFTSDTDTKTQDDTDREGEPKDPQACLVMGQAKTALVVSFRSFMATHKIWRVNSRDGGCSFARLKV